MCPERTVKFWSGRRDSNPRPRPWQGRALPLSYTRIREAVGDRAPTTRRAMPNAHRECNSRCVTRNRPDHRILAITRENQPEMACESWPISRAVFSGGNPDGWAIQCPAQRFEPFAEPAPKCSGQFVTLGASQSKVAHHSTEARSPSTIGMIDKVAWNPVTGHEGAPQNS
jgi:hypothetical protein